MGKIAKVSTMTIEVPSEFVSHFKLMVSGFQHARFIPARIERDGGGYKATMQKSAFRFLCNYTETKFAHIPPEFREIAIRHHDHDNPDLMIWIVRTFTTNKPQTH